MIPTEPSEAQLSVQSPVRVIPACSNSLARSTSKVRLCHIRETEAGVGVGRGPGGPPAGTAPHLHEFTIRILLVLCRSRCFELAEVFENRARDRQRLGVPVASCLVI